MTRDESGLRGEIELIRFKHHAIAADAPDDGEMVIATILDIGNGGNLQLFEVIEGQHNAPCTHPVAGRNVRKLLEGRAIRCAHAGQNVLFGDGHAVEFVEDRSKAGCATGIVQLLLNYPEIAQSFPGVYGWLSIHKTTRKNISYQG